MRLENYHKLIGKAVETPLPPEQSAIEKVKSPKKKKVLKVSPAKKKKSPKTPIT